EQRSLRMLTYGEHDEADIRLVSWNDGYVRAQFHKAFFEFRLGAHGKHMALNALAVICSMMALGLSWKNALPSFAAFEPVGGRGEEARISIFGKRVKLINEAYHANPLSMAAALAA